MARQKEFDESNVLDIAMNLFWEKGYNAVSTQDLIEAFGISRSSMYGTFKDKKSLFILSLRHYRQTVTKEMTDTINSNRPIKEIISEILNKLVRESICDDKSRGCFVVNTAIELAPHDKDILEIIQDNRNNIIQSIKSAVQKGIEKGEISKDKNPNALAVYLYSIINGLWVDAKVHKTKSHYKETVEIALKSLDD